MGSRSVIGDGDINNGYYDSNISNAEINGTIINGRTKTYGTYREMLQDRQPGRFAYVLDASGDATVGSGFAYYVYDEGVWKKLFEQEAMDVEHNGHTHANMEVLNNFGIIARRPTFNGMPLAYKTEIPETNTKPSEVIEVTRISQFKYEFIDEDIATVLEEKTYIIRNCQFIGQLRLGQELAEDICYRLVVDSAAAGKGGAIVPSFGDSINGGNVFYLTQSMDVRIIYDRKNSDWIVIGTFN